MNHEFSVQLDPQNIEPDEIIGTVAAVQANYYWVQLLPNFLPPVVNAKAPLSLLCTRRSRLKKIGQQVMVGDRVRVAEPDWIDGRGVITEVFPRSSWLDRPPIANADQMLLVFAMAEPELDPYQLSRFLVKAESTGLAVALCLNKSDLVPSETRQHWCDRLQQWGYSPLMISLRSGSSLRAVRQQLEQRITVVSGPSGVGKSSLINQLVPTVDLRVGAVSGKLGRGRHTTRHVELFELPTGGLLADTPGFNQPDLDCTPTELGRYFPEIKQRLRQNQCQFSNCLHRDEPNCAVRGDWERYAHYLRLLEEAIAHEVALEKLGDAESTTKIKIRHAGQLQSEPKLQTKKYRRPSRRTQRQSLQGSLDPEEWDIDAGDQ
jgi:ribosome biogenesis GTPase